LSKVSLDLDLLRRRFLEPHTNRIGYPEYELKKSVAYPSPLPTGLTCGFEVKERWGKMWVNNRTTVEGNIALGYFTMASPCKLLSARPLLRGDIKIVEVEEYAPDTWLRMGLVYTIRVWDGSKWVIGTTQRDELYIEFDWYRSAQARAQEIEKGVLGIGNVIEYYMTIPYNISAGEWRHYVIDMYDVLVRGYANMRRCWGRHVADVAQPHSIYAVIECTKGRATLEVRDLEVVW